MNPNLKDHGDEVERTYASFIQEHIPAYESMWARFIGNDGASRLVAPDHLGQPKQEKRERTAQHTYTALEALLCARLLLDRVEAEQIGTSTISDRTARYLFAINDLVAFYAQIGRVRDAFVALSKLWKDVGISKGLNEYYQQRNTVLHEIKIPFKFEGTILSIVAPQGATHDRTRWGSGLFWSQASEMPLTAVPDLLDRVLKEVSTLSNNAFARLHSEHLSKAFPTLPKVIGEIVYKRLDIPSSAAIAISTTYSITSSRA